MTKHSKLSKPLVKQAECISCQRVLTTNQSLKRHQSTCKLYLQYVAKQNAQKELENAQKEIDKLALELEASKVQNQELADKIKEVPASTTTIINNTYNHYNNSTQNYQQNNMLHMARESIDRLVPITTELLANMVHSSLHDSRQRSSFLDNIETLSETWMQGPLKNSVMVTDTARKIAHWKDGDQDNKSIRDPFCDALSKKLQSAIDETKLNEYSAYITKELSSDHAIDIAVPAIGSQLLVAHLKTKEVKDLGKSLVKYAPTAASQMISHIETLKMFTSFKRVVQESYKIKVMHIIISTASNIGSFWLVQHLLAKHADDVHVTKQADGGNLVFMVANDRKFKCTWTPSQFMDFIKHCILELGSPTEQTLIVAETLRNIKEFACLFDSKEQVRQNFQNFNDWLAFDRMSTTYSYKAEKTAIQQYENQMLLTINASVSGGV